MLGLLPHLTQKKKEKSINLPDGRGGHALVLLVQADLLQSNDLIIGPVLRLVNNPVRPLTDLLKFLLTTKNFAFFFFLLDRCACEWGKISISFFFIYSFVEY